MARIDKSIHRATKNIDDIAESIGRMREQPDGEGNSRMVATQSVFKEAKELLKQQRDNGMDEKFSKVVLEKLYEMLENLIPIAEHQYRKYPGDRFAGVTLNTYIVQMRDVMKDIRSIRSFEEQTARITNYNFIIFQQMVQSYADEMQRIRTAIKNETDPKTLEKLDSVLMRSLDSHGAYIQEALKAVNAKVEEQLN